MLFFIETFKYPFSVFSLMDLSAATSLADPQFLADQIQNQVDSIAGKHIDLVSLQLLANIIEDIDIIYIIAVNFAITTQGLIRILTFQLPSGGPGSYYTSLLIQIMLPEIF